MKHAYDYTVKLRRPMPGSKPSVDVPLVLVHTFDHLTSGIVEIEPDVSIISLSEAYTTHESHLARIDFNRRTATSGPVSLDAFGAVGSAAYAGKVLIDVANAITPSFELMYSNDSLGEKLQKVLPEARVVKTLNTASSTVLTEPGPLGPSSGFLSGDDEAAKATVASLLGDLGCSDGGIVDLGGIASARGVESYFLMFAALMRSTGGSFNIRVVTA